MRLGHLVLAAANLGASLALLSPLLSSHGAKTRALDTRSIELPTCAESCLADALSASPCAATDVACICANAASISAAMTPCLLASCPTTIDMLHTQRYSAATCGAPVRDETHTMIVCQWTLFSLAVVFIVLRFISRAPYFGGRLGWDDWTMLLLIALQLAINILSHFLFHYGFGKDLYMLEEFEIVAIFKLYLACEVLYHVEVTLLKVSVLLQYLRIFNFRILSYSLMAISIGGGVAFTVAMLASCNPFGYFFQRWKFEAVGTCIDIHREIYASAVFNIVVDGIIILLPTTQIFTLQMNTQKKLVVAFAFLAGFIVTAISIARLVVFERAAESNFTYTYVGVSILSIAEMNISVVSASVPAVVSLVRRAQGKRDTTKGSSGNTPGAVDFKSASSKHSGGSKKKGGGSDRWHGFTDVFSTRGSATLVASSHQRSRADMSNDEFELLEEPNGAHSSQVVYLPHQTHSDSSPSYGEKPGTAV